MDAVDADKNFIICKIYPYTPLEIPQANLLFLMKLKHLKCSLLWILFLRRRGIYFERRGMYLRRKGIYSINIFLSKYIPIYINFQNI